MNFHNGDKFMGRWQEDAPNGFGLYYCKVGGHFEGNFVNGVLNGYGTVRYENGDMYDGE